MRIGRSITPVILALGCVGSFGGCGGASHETGSTVQVDPKEEADFEAAYLENDQVRAQQARHRRRGDY